jgi:hypothetical protein
VKISQGEAKIGSDAGTILSAQFSSPPFAYMSSIADRIQSGRGPAGLANGDAKLLIFSELGQGTI